MAYADQLAASYTEALLKNPAATVFENISAALANCPPQPVQAASVDYRPVYEALERLTRACESRENWKAQGITHDDVERECWDAMKAAQKALRETPSPPPR